MMDFESKEGMKRLLTKLDVLQMGGNPKMKFKNYDWNLFLYHHKTVS
jgi:hypothetical protein